MGRLDRVGVEGGLARLTGGEDGWLSERLREFRVAMLSWRARGWQERILGGGGREKDEDRGAAVSIAN